MRRIIPETNQFNCSQVTKYLDSMIKIERKKSTSEIHFICFVEFQLSLAISKHLYDFNIWYLISLFHFNYYTFSSGRSHWFLEMCVWFSYLNIWLVILNFVNATKIHFEHKIPISELKNQKKYFMVVGSYI